MPKEFVTILFKVLTISMKPLDSVNRIISITKDFDKYFFYCVDPGAFYCMEFIYDTLSNMEQKVYWVAEGWAKDKIKQRYAVMTWKEFELFVTNKPTNNYCLFLGPQVNFNKTHETIEFCKNRIIYSFFIFDHWNNYLNHFYNFKNKTLTLPTNIGVMDKIAFDCLIKELGKVEYNEQYLQNIHIVGHPKIEHSVRVIKNYPQVDLKEFRREIGALNKKVYLFLLEPIHHDFSSDEVGKPSLGFDEYTILKYFFDNYQLRNAKVIIKPHPRQDIYALNLFLGKIDHSLFDYYVDDEHVLELLIAVSDEVFGIQTVALIIALFAGKPIKSIQVGRNEKGRKDSNEYFERNLIIA